MSKGIRTLYRGILFRSRTEARWAAFFDALGWHWEYEPADLDGYLPDFLLPFDGGDLIVEVKGPVEDMAIAESKIECSGWRDEALVVSGAMSPVIGRLLEWDGTEPLWGHAELFTCLSCGSPSVRSVDGSWRCRVCGACDGNAHVGDFDPSKAWAAATNRVQWRAA